MTQAPTSHPSRHEDEFTSTEIAGIRRRLDRRHLVSLHLELPLKIVLRHSVDPGLHVQSRNSSMNQRRTMIPKTRTILGSRLKLHTSSLMHWDTPNLARMMRTRKRRIWDAINIFAGQDIQSLLQGPDIDSIVNIICLERNCHSAFGKFKLWFEDDPVGHLH